MSLDVQTSQEHPPLVSLKDGERSPQQRRAEYALLIASGYRFAGTELGSSLWTRMDSLPQNDPVVSLSFSQPIYDGRGVVCFDLFDNQPPKLTGRINLTLSGWAFLDTEHPVPDSIYVEVLDMRTQHLEYFSATRCPRPDVAQHFGNSGLLMSGFRVTIPIRRSYSSGLRLRIIQCTLEHCYRSSTDLVIERGTEQYERSVRQDLARKFLRGSGIEIGALQRRLEIPETCSIRYVDRMALPGLLQHYPELGGMPLQEPDIVDNGEQLQTIADGSLDFVIANHFLEHCENPIQTVSNLLRVLKPFGILFMAVPDKRYTFDSERPSTSYTTLRSVYKSGIRTDRLELFNEWVELVEMCQPEQQGQRVAQLLRENYSIHFNVWSADDLLAFLMRAREEFELPFNISSVVCSENEAIVLLERDVSRI